MYGFVEIFCLCLLIQTTKGKVHEDEIRKKTHTGLYTIKTNYAPPPTYRKFGELHDKFQSEDEILTAEVQKNIKSAGDQFMYENESINNIIEGNSLNIKSLNQADRDLVVIGFFLIPVMLVISFNILIAKVLTSAPSTFPTPGPTPLSSIPPSEAPSLSHRPTTEAFVPSMEPSKTSEPSRFPNSPPSQAPTLAPTNLVSNVIKFLDGLRMIYLLFFGGLFEDILVPYEPQPQDNWLPSE